MAKHAFETARDEVEHICNATETNLRPADILAKAALVDGPAQLSRLLHDLAKDGAISRHQAPEGSGRGVMFVYGPGTVTPAPRPRRMGGFMAAKRERETKGEKGKARGGTRRDQAAAAAAIPVTVPAAAPMPARCWALTNDGAFLLLGTPVEIRGTAARALVDFIRVLDQAQA